MLTRVKLILLIIFLLSAAGLQTGSSHTHTSDHGSAIPAASIPENTSTMEATPAEWVIAPDITNLQALSEVDFMTDNEINQKYDQDYFIDLLREIGYYKDEYYRELDWRNAVLRYQSWNNLVVDGVFTVKLKRMLLKGIVRAKPDILPDSVPRGWWITINKTRRILTIYKDRNVHKKCPISAGRLPSFTPEGKFKIVNKFVNPAWSNHGRYSPGGHPNNPLGKRWMGLSPEGGSTYGIHGSNLPFSIGTDGSAGCIRMINSEVEEIYQYIPIGTEVWIGTDRRLEEWGIKAEPSLGDAYH